MKSDLPAKLWEAWFRTYYGPDAIMTPFPELPEAVREVWETVALVAVPAEKERPASRRPRRTRIPTSDITPNLKLL